VERSIINKFRALSSCSDPLILRLFSVNAQLDFIHKDLFQQTHVNNLVHINRSRSFYSMFLPVDLKLTIAKDRKEVATIDDA